VNGRAAGPNLTSRQRDLLGAFREAVVPLTLRWDDARGVARSARGPLARRTGAATPEQTVQTFRERFGDLFEPRGQGRALRLLRSRQDSRGWTHFEFQQTYDGGQEGQSSGPALDVYGARLAAHVERDGTLAAVQSSCWRDVEVAATPRLHPSTVRDLLRRAAEEAPGYRELEELMRKREERGFPVVETPRLVVYPWQRAFRLAWTTHAYGSWDAGPGEGLELSQVFVDDRTGEVFLSAPLTMHAENPVAGTGLAVTPLGGPYTVRALNVVWDTVLAVHRLKDVTHARHIITHDAACTLSGPDAVAAAITGAAPPISENAGIDWNSTVPAATRTNSQQPEVDAHFFATQAYEWYDALAGGRAGWDDGKYSDPPVDATLPVRVVTHALTPATPCDFPDAWFSMRSVGGRWIPFIVFQDGEPGATCTAAGDRSTDFMAGARFLVGHEYHHVITTFSFEDGAGKPGLGYAGWSAAMHEGLADAFAGFFSGVWAPAPEISAPGLVFRNLVFPRDTTSWMNLPGTYPCGRRDPLAPEQITKDHFGDRDTPPEPAPPPPPPPDEPEAVKDLRRRIFYFRGAILAHCAFLLARGGVHQRASRTPELIPVSALGNEMVGGQPVPRAARIWYRALTWYFSTHGELTGIPTIDENLFRTFGEACVDAAEELWGADSPEHCTTKLALYAVGLYPAPAVPAVFYGADVTFLRWGWDWRQSRPYLGGIHSSSPDWASLDLFVNNGGASEWNAIVNVLDAANQPTLFENTVYCRVRNVGDQQAVNVRVDFFWAKAGTNPPVWQAVTGAAANPSSLTIASLAPGESSFADGDQDNPPATAGVPWYIPPLAPGEIVDHFCLKAVVSADNDVNQHNNTVQSNIAYVAYVPGSNLVMRFFAANPGKKKIPLELEVKSGFPEGWKVQRVGPDRKYLRPGEELPVRLALRVPAGGGLALEPPFDGEVVGHLSDPLSGACRGALTHIAVKDAHLTGQIAVTLEGVGGLGGRFEGTLDRERGALRGRVLGGFQSVDGGRITHVAVRLEGWLRPWRRVDVSQRVRGETVGGVTIQIQRPAPDGPWPPLPPADTRVTDAVNRYQAERRLRARGGPPRGFR
jgi:hypothetical protein